MKTIYSEKLPRILKNRKRLEKRLGVKIRNRGKEVFVESSPEEEYVAEKVIDALNFGFPFFAALLIKEKDFLFEVFSIKEHTKRKDLSKIRARIIGKEGKTLKVLSELTGCFFELKDNEVGIVGHPEEIKNAQDAVIRLIQGAKQGNVYSYLEKNQTKKIWDLGLKKEGESND